jgi:(p)ppGpp synthase/HD superfamily hydrolase
MSTLERAIAIAAKAHAGQVDKAGAPYVLHPLRIMLRKSSIDERIVAVLHDVCENCPGWTFERLRK